MYHETVWRKKEMILYKMKYSNTKDLIMMQEISLRPMSPNIADVYTNCWKKWGKFDEIRKS